MFVINVIFLGGGGIKSQFMSVTLGANIEKLHLWVFTLRPSSPIEFMFSSPRGKRNCEYVLINIFLSAPFLHDKFRDVI